MHIPTCRQHTS